MQRVRSTDHLDRSDTGGEGLWIERLQQRPASAPSKAARTEGADARQAEGMWIERLQQRRFFAGGKGE